MLLWNSLSGRSEERQRSGRFKDVRYKVGLVGNRLVHRSTNELRDVFSVKVVQWSRQIEAELLRREINPTMKSDKEGISIE